MKEEAKTVMLCPSCKGSHIVKCGFTRKNIQRYKCQSCNYRFVEFPEQVQYSKHEVTCPLCSHKYSKKAGKYTNGKQYYKCIKCGHKFLQEGKFKQVTQKQKDLIVMYNINLGVSKKQIAEYLGINQKTVYNVIRRYKEKENG